MPNLIPDWHFLRPAGRLIWSCLLLVIGLAIAFWLFKRPKPNRKATWAECMAGAVGVFALMTLAYAVIPSEWITFSDKYLQWDTTHFVFQSHQPIPVLNDVFGVVSSQQLNYPFSMNKQAVRDIIVVLIYAVFFGLNLKLFSDWQKRGKVVATEAGTPRTSRFGRPLRRPKAVPAAMAEATSGDGA